MLAIFWTLPLGASEFVLGSAIPKTDVIVIGEIHDNPIHHENQATLITQINPSAVVFEMLSPEQVSAIENLPRGDPRALEEALEWESSGWPDFKLYFPVFMASRTAPFYGAAAPIGQVRSAISEGAAAVFGQDAKSFGLNLSLEPEEGTAREAFQAEVHCGALPETMLPGMVEAQRFRDAHFSKVTLQALADTRGPVVVITGNGHARTDWGMPRALKSAAPDATVLSIGQVSRDETDPPFDLWIFTENVVRDHDPCDAFKSN